MQAAQKRCFRSMAKGKRGAGPWQYRVSPRPSRSRGNGLLQRQTAQPELRILLHEIAHGPVVRKKHDRLLKLVLAKADSRRDDQARRVPEGWMRLYPAYEAPGSLLQPRFRAILALQPVLHDLELEGSDGRKKGRPWRSRPGRERIGRATAARRVAPGGADRAVS